VERLKPVVRSTIRTRSSSAVYHGSRGTQRSASAVYRGPRGTQRSPSARQPTRPGGHGCEADQQAQTSTREHDSQPRRCAARRLLQRPPRSPWHTEFQRVRAKCPSGLENTLAARGAPIRRTRAPEANTRGNEADRDHAPETRREHRTARSSAPFSQPGRNFAAGSLESIGLPRLSLQSHRCTEGSRHRTVSIGLHRLCTAAPAVHSGLHQLCITDPTVRRRRSPSPLFHCGHHRLCTTAPAVHSGLHRVRRGGATLTCSGHHW
jgi:hypothetical protein